MKKLILSLSLVVCVVCCFGDARPNNDETLSIGLTSKASRQADVNPSIVTGAIAKTREVSSSAAAVLDLLSSKLSSLDYNSSKCFSILVPGFNQEFFVSWGFEGSGPLLLPFSPITIAWKSPTSKDKQEAFSVTEFLKVVAQNEITKNGFQFPALGWLGGVGYEPLKVFAIKVALLFSNKVFGKNTPNIPQELVRLLVRLSLSDNGNVLVGKHLSQMIPDEIREFISLTMPHGEFEKTLEFIDQIWTILIGSSTNLDSKDIQGLGSSYCFIFNDSNFATRCLGYLKNYKEKDGDLGSILKEYATKNGYEVVIDPSEFTKLDATIPAGTPTNVYEPAKKMIGFRSFGAATSAATINALPTEIKAAIKQSLGGGEVNLVDTHDGRAWLVYATSNMGYVDAFSGAMLSLVKALKDYAKVKKDLVAADPSILQKETSLLIEQADKLKEEISELNRAIKSKQVQVHSQKQRGFIQRLRKTNDAVINGLEAEIRTMQADVSQKRLKLAGIESKLENASELKTFANDICGESKDLASIREELVSSLSKIIKNTKQIQTNMPVYEYLVKSLNSYMPELTPILVRAFGVAKIS